jgi:hypothetical protein
MEFSDRAHVLVVAYKTAATPGLLEAIRERAERSPARFSLLIPDEVPGLGPGRRQLEWAATTGEQILALALPLMEEAAGEPVTGRVSADPSPFDAVEEELQREHYDEIIVSCLPRRVSHWLHIDLPANLGHLGLPITTVIARQEAHASA